MESAEREYDALCAGCAQELAGDAEPALVTDASFDGACERCGAILSGFFYAAPHEAARTGGFVPGAG